VIFVQISISAYPPLLDHTGYSSPVRCTSMWPHGQSRWSFCSCASAYAVRHVSFNLYSV